MSDLAQVLQQRIEQLEAGDPLEVCLAGLPEQETKALQLIAAIHTMSMDDADEKSITAQRADVLKAAAARLDHTTPLPAHSIPFLAQLQTLVDRLLTRRELAIGLASLFVITLLGAAWLGMSRWRHFNSPETITPVVDGHETTTAESNAPSITLEEAGNETDTTVTNATAANAPHTTFLPSVSTPLNLTPQTAAVAAVEGVTEIQGEDGTWTAVGGIRTITAGQHVRTGPLSQATITFFDGSQASLSAHTEVSIDELDAQRPEAGFRTVILTQHTGESHHNVQFRNDGGSRYEVKTPAGSGIARGTKFHVLVTPDLLARFAVTEGKVDVTGLSQTVSVIAGQLTTVVAGRAPESPVFRITGEGEVNQIGTVWIIAGQPFQTHDQTIIIGHPQIGDMVFVEGHLSSNDGRVADRIILLRPALANHFTLTGEVETIDVATWTVAGQILLIDEDTEIEDDITVGDRVRVEGVILPGGSLLAEEIERVEDDTVPGLPFSFNGIVQAMNTDTWTISGIVITVDAETDIDDDIHIGDVVAVDGWILDDGTWLAQHIEQVEDDDELPAFTFTGHVQSIAPWQVAGIAFETRDWTVIEPGITVGDLVRVSGFILEDGTWVAAAIEKIDHDETNTIVLVGVVNSIDPWIVNGLQLFVTDATVILGDIVVGDLVIVEIELLPDGTWQVLSIRPLHPHFGLGCFFISTAVLGVQPNQLTLKHWPAITLDDEIKIEGDIKTDSIITFPICIHFDGTIIIVGTIIVIYQPIIIIVPPAPAPPRGNGNHNG